jgi:hypothetical protein
LKNCQTKVEAEKAKEESKPATAKKQVKKDEAGVKGHK